MMAMAKLKQAFLVAFVTGIGSAALGAGAQVAVVDMAKLIRSHPDALEADALLKKTAEEFEAEQKEIVGQLEKLQGEFRSLREAARNPMLSESAKQRKTKEIGEKYKTVREFEQTASKKLALRQKQLTDQKRRLRKAIAEKIGVVVETYAKEKGFVLVLNATGKGLRGNDMVIFAQGRVDITEDILKLINPEKEKQA